MKVLIVDDDPMNILILKRHLLKRGHEVSSCNDGDSAWKRLETEPFPVVISDWMMPGTIDGVELCRLVRRKSGGDVYLILITAKTEVKEREEAEAAGVDRFLVKPFDPNALTSYLAEAEARSARESNELSSDPERSP